MKSSVTLVGVKEIDQVLQQLPVQVADKVLQRAGAAAAKPLISKAKLTAPEGPTGNLVDSIGALMGRFNQVRSLQRQLGEVFVGPRRGGRYKGWAAHLVEYGTKKRATRKKANRGTMPKKPFMEPAFLSTKAAILSLYKIEVAKKVYAVMRRYIKRSVA